MKGLIKKQGTYVTLYEVEPDNTFFVAKYATNIVTGGGLANTGWDTLPHGIEILTYKLSTGKLITFPKYEYYMHLVEASTSIDKNGNLSVTNYHAVYVKGYKDGKVITHRISLRGRTPEDIGVVDIYESPKEEFEKFKSWKRGA